MIRLYTIMIRLYTIMIRLYTIMILLFISCSPDEDIIHFDRIVETKTSYSKLELDVLNLLNDYRIEKTLDTLTRLNYISSVALTHTIYMIEKGEVSHDNFSERLENLILYASAEFVGENVAYGYGTAKGVVGAWIKSEKHTILMKRPDYTHFGISIEEDWERRNYFTLIFIKK